jgi:hypothetical protein
VERLCDAADLPKRNASRPRHCQNARRDLSECASIPVLPGTEGPDGELPEELQRLDPKLVEAVCNDIIDADGRSTVWDDIAGQQDAKRLVRDLLVLPMMAPHLFKVRRTS